MIDAGCSKKHLAGIDSYLIPPITVIRFIRNLLKPSAPSAPWPPLRPGRELLRWP